MKITYLLSHVPGPRLYKKMKKAREKFDLSVIYRNRKLENFQTFFGDQAIEKHEIMNEKYRLWIIPINMYWKYFNKALDRLKLINPDIIHCGNLDMLLLAVIFKKRIKKNTKIIYEIGDLNKRTYNNSKKLNKIIIKKILIFLERKMFNYVDQLIISSQYFWDNYYIYFISKDRVFLFPNMPEKEIFNKIKENNNNILTIGFIGRIRYYNQLKMLLDVVHLINKNNKKELFKVLIAGEGPESKLLLNDVAKYDFIDIYGPYNYEKEIVKIYTKVDLVYSVYDALNQNVQIAIPNRLYESIVSEKPIIVAKNTRLADFVIENKVGFAVDSSESKDLLHLLDNIISGKIKLSRIKKQCKLIKNDYYIDIYQEKLIKMYSSMIK